MKNPTLKQASSFLSKEQLKKIKSEKETIAKHKFIQKIHFITGYRFETEFKFHPKRRWRIDYACPELKLAIEVEGGAWINGRHTRGSGFLKDMEKYNELAAADWILIRTTPENLLSDETITFVVRCINNRIFFKKILP
jgi:very-short-patch-repair endonuclease